MQPHLRLTMDCTNAFVCHFGLRNASTTFQRTLDVLLATGVAVWFGLIGRYSYILRITGTRYSSHSSIRTFLNYAAIVLMFKKYHVFREIIKYQNKKFPLRRVEVSSPTPDDIHRLTEPTRVTKRRSFLDLCNVLRWFVPNIAPLAASINKKLWKNQPTKVGPFNEEQLAVMSALWRAVVSSVALDLPKFTAHMTWDTNDWDK